MSRSSNVAAINEFCGQVLPIIANCYDRLTADFNNGIKCNCGGSCYMSLLQQRDQAHLEPAFQYAPRPEEHNDRLINFSHNHSHSSCCIIQAAHPHGRSLFAPGRSKQ